MTQARQIEYIGDYNDLEEGDILLFRATPQTPNITLILQSLVKQPHGHYDTVHAGMCTGHDEKKQAIISHIIATKERLGYRQETLADHMKSIKSGDRAFLVFRNKDKVATKDYARIAGDEKAYQNVAWSRTASASIFFHSSAVAPDRPYDHDKTIETASSCTQFLVEVMEKSEAARYKKGEEFKRTNILAASSPKALEKYFYDDHENFQMLCYPGRNHYQLLKSEIQSQISRVNERQDLDSLYKYRQATRQFNSITKRVDENEQLNDLQRSLALLKTMLPILNYSTGLGLFETTSHKAVRQLARTMGIFQRDIDNFRLPEIKDEKSKLELRS